MNDIKGKYIYIVGIEGAGTSALAKILQSRGAIISGSDDGDGFYRVPLRKMGIRVYEQFDPAHITNNIDYAIHSTAFGDDNVEIAQINKHGIRLVSYPEAVAEIFNTMKGIAICGTHGKTTTTALASEILRTCEKDPVALVGSQIVGWNGNALTGHGDIMVLEADEYQNKLQYYNPKIVVLTSVDYDHPDFFATEEEYRQAFIDFVARVPKDGVVIACSDSPHVVQVVKDAQPQCSVIFYGLESLAENQITHYTTEISDNLPTIQFVLNQEEFTLHIPGKHNALNATAAILVAQQLQCTTACIQEGLRKFHGAMRRFEMQGVCNDSILIDDYAHHPKEIVATLSAVRDLYPHKNIIAAFHPHTFTRTKALLSDFAQSFCDADQVIIIDIYGSARETQGGIGAQDVVNAIDENKKIEWNAVHHNTKYQSQIKYISTIEDLAQWARTNLQKDDVFITLGAGDIWKVHNLIKK